MRKRWMALLCAGMLSVGLLAGCGSTEKADDTASSKTEETEETEETKETETEEEVEQETEKEVDEGEAALENTEASADLGDTWVNMEARRFAVNGNVYELGVTTLQDMIDDGVPLIPMRNLPDSISYLASITMYRFLLETLQMGI